MVPTKSRKAFIYTYLRNLRRQRDVRYRRYVQANTLFLPVTVKDLICNKDINILGTRYFVFLNATLGTQ